MTHTKTTIPAAELVNGDFLHRPHVHAFTRITVNKAIVAPEVRVFIETEGSWGYIDLRPDAPVTVLR